MSEEGEKTCPLCAEEMDLTDQQLKPCKCGYEVCVWCWHHIMEMAEKDETDGRCPACRSPYDKEKIVGTSSKCGRLAADLSMEKKKSQKAKTKISEGRKQLSSVRVIQRNLVYIVGLPLNLADEDLLQHKEYFGQYGKVLKVSISRTSAGTIQQFANNTCSVYITYLKEEEAVRCIQSIHGYTLDGRSLRACFGTTKYCHAWLRNAPCTNPDCLYLHEIGSQEDSFSKDEIISAYSRVQQITGIANNGQRRAGSAFPPPADDYCNNSSAATTGKPAVKVTPNNVVSSARVSPPSSSAGRAGALPAAASWASRGSNSQMSTGAIVSSNGPTKQKPDEASASLEFSSAAAGMPQASVPSTGLGLGKKDILNADIPPKEPKNKTKPIESKNQLATDPRSIKSEGIDTPVLAHTAPITADGQSLPPTTSGNSKLNVDKQSNIVDTEKMYLTTIEKNQRLRPDITSTSTDKQIFSKSPGVAKPNGLTLDCFLVQRDQGLQESIAANLQYLASPSSGPPISSVQRTDLQSSAQPTSESVKDFENQRLSDAIVTHTSFPSSPHSFNVFNQIRGQSHNYSAAAASHTVHPLNKPDEGHLDVISSNGSVNNQVQTTSEAGHSYVHRDHMGLSGNFAATIDSTSGEDVIENSIITNILSLDLDAWDDPLTSSQNFVNLLGENERQQNSFNFSSSWKAQNSNQSRFSFARQEESRNHSLDVEPSYNNGINPLSFAQYGEPYLERLGTGYGRPQHSAEQYDNFGHNHSVSSLSKPSAVPRSQISAPPGFSVPNRPPPGFSSHVRSDQPFDIKSGNHFLESTSFRTPYHATPSGNSSSIADIEFMDPAILAVGKGRPPSSLGNSSLDMGPAFSAQTSSFENDSRLQLLMQRSLQSHQNYRYADAGENFSPSDAYNRFSSRQMEPSQMNGVSSFSQYAPQSRGSMSNGHWDNWSDVSAGNNMGMADLLRNDRVSFNKLYGGYEESKFQMPGAGDLYNRTFGM